MKRNLFLLSALCALIISCSKDMIDASEHDQNDQNVVSSVDPTVIINGEGEVIFSNMLPIRDEICTNASYSTFQEGDMMELRSGGSEIGGPYTVVGYTGREMLRDDIKLYIVGKNPYGLAGAYLCTLYKYYYQITIPHNANLLLPAQPVNPKNMGAKEKVLASGVVLTAGYLPQEGQKNAAGDTYYLTTHVWIITHNILGQRVGPYFYPGGENPRPNAPSIKDPNTFIFKYAWSKIEWS